MKKFKNILKLILQIIFFISIFSKLYSKNFDNTYEADKVSDYFTGITSLNDNDYANSYKYLKKLNNLEDKHYIYSKLYQHTSVNSENFNEAFKYAKKLVNKKIDNFESNLIIGVYYLRQENFEQALKYFKKLNKEKNTKPFEKYLSESLVNLVNYKNVGFKVSSKALNLMPKEFDNLKKIQNAFLHCFYQSKETDKIFKQLTSNTDGVSFSRYNYFYGAYLNSKGKKINAKQVIDSAIKIFPSNILLNQFKIDMEKNFFYNQFECQKISHITAELFYIIANSLSAQSLFSPSNFYLNLSKYLNPNFLSFDLLYAENFYRIEDYDKSKKIYANIRKKGQVYGWHSVKQITSILMLEKKEEEALNFFQNQFKTIKNPKVSQMLDYAEFLKNNEKFKDSIIYYSKVLKKINKKHFLYTKATYGRGVSYERTNEWKKAEIDLKNSLKANPKQAYVINYLAYSWIEQGIKIDEALSMLIKANEIKKNDGYIVDSLGWALFQLEKFDEAKKYLQLAVMIMPFDPIVNDHYADALWFNENKIQARYYWNYVLNLKKTEDGLKTKIKKKLTNGPKREKKL